MTDLPRRAFLTGLTGLICAPAIVRASSLMAVRAEAKPALWAWPDGVLEYPEVPIPAIEMSPYTKALLESFRQTKWMIEARVLEGTGFIAESPEHIVFPVGR